MESSLNKVLIVAVCPFPVREPQETMPERNAVKGEMYNVMLNTVVTQPYDLNTKARIAKIA